MTEHKAPLGPVQDHEYSRSDPAVAELFESTNQGELGRGFFQLVRSFGFPANSRSNLHELDEDLVLFLCSNTAQILNIQTRDKRFITSCAAQHCGVTAAAVHPSRRFFALAQCLSGVSPAVLIYSFPALKVVRILRGGTEQRYSDLRFSAAGDKLASVGSAPDFTLTVWNWRDEKVILRTKAFGQEVHRVRFSPVNEGVLVTSGTGHIRFWKMATTFTGLKLQGAIGKFGNVDLTDINCFLELPNGKVVSGSENGQLLVWDGNLLEFPVRTKAGQPCHHGTVEHIALHGRLLTTAGTDGFIRTWDYDELEFAELDYDSEVHEMDPVMQTSLGEHVSIKSMLELSDRHWLVHNQHGSLLKYREGEADIETVFSFHAGCVTALLPCAQFKHVFISAGVDSTVRLWDVVSNKQLALRSFSSPVRCLISLPPSVAGADHNNTYLAGCADGVVRVLAIVARTTAEGTTTLALSLVHAFKPHHTPLVEMTVSPNGNTLATLAESGSLFFTQVASASSYVPLGFLRLQSTQDPVVTALPSLRSLSWSRDSRHIAFVDGTAVVVVRRPEDTVVQQARDTYELALDSLRVARVEVKTRFEEDEEEEEEKKEEEEKEADTTAEEPVVKKERQQCLSAVTFDLEDEHTLFVTVSSRLKTPDTGPWKSFLLRAELPRKPPPVVTWSFTVSANDVQASEASTVAVYPLDVPGTSPSVVSRLHAVPSAEEDSTGGALLIGCSNGVAQLRPLLSPERFSLLLAQAVKENNGMVTALGLSLAAGLCGVAGLNGGCFIYRTELGRAMGPPMPAEELKSVMVLPPPDPLDGVPVVEGDQGEDILDPAVYSFARAKEQQGLDSVTSAAEKKKMTVKEHVEVLRKRYRALVERNAELPTQQLSAEELDVDPELTAMLEARAKERVEQVRHELAWETEKKTLALQKLRRRFLDHVVVEHISLASFRAGVSVSSIRTVELPTHFVEQIDALHAELDAAAARAPTAEEVGDISIVVQDQANGVVVESGSSALEASSSEAQRRRKAREKRKQLRAALEATKPSLTQDDPADLAAVEEAEANMGDFKLKSDPSYVVPECQRVNAAKKKREMLLLVESLNAIKCQFNDQFLALRELKKQIIETIAQDNVRLRQLNAELGLEACELFEPTLDRNEWPELRGEFSEEDLRAFEAQLAEEKKQAAETKRRAVAAYGDMAEEGRTEAKKVRGREKRAAAALKRRLSSKKALKRSSLTRRQRESTVESKEEPKAEEFPAEAEIKLSPLEEAEREKRCRLLAFERQTLLDKLNETVERFDERVMELRLERFRLVVDLKAADIHFLELYRELQLLKEFEETETNLFASLTKLRAHKHEIVSAMRVCERGLQEKLKLVEAWQRKDKNLMEQFTELVGGARGQHHAKLLKIFCRKIKRRRRRVVEHHEEEKDVTVGEESSDESDSSQSLSGDESEDEADVCPTGFDLATYEKMLDLREVRLKQEDELAEFNAAVTELNKKYQQHQFREKNVDKQLLKNRMEIEAFQSEKQKALNQLEVIVTLRLSQIKYLVNGRLPRDPSKILIFTASRLAQLRARIDELHHEKLELRARFHALKKEHKEVQKQLKEQRERIEAEHKKCHDVQMLKFGQVIDLSILEKVGVDEQSASLRGRLQELEHASNRRLQEWDTKMRTAREELAQVTSENTRLLERVAALTHQQFELENELNMTVKNVKVADTRPAEQREALERDRLLGVVQQQENEIETLKAEILSLRTKSGFIGAP